jgi:hypothetical protein
MALRCRDYPFHLKIIINRKQGRIVIFLFISHFYAKGTIKLFQQSSCYFWFYEEISYELIIVPVIGVMQLTKQSLYKNVYGIETSWLDKAWYVAKLNQLTKFYQIPIKTDSEKFVFQMQIPFEY